MIIMLNNYFYILNLITKLLLNYYTKLIKYPNNINPTNKNDFFLFDFIGLKMRKQSFPATNTIPNAQSVFNIFSPLNIILSQENLNTFGSFLSLIIPNRLERFPLEYEYYKYPLSVNLNSINCPLISDLG